MRDALCVRGAAYVRVRCNCANCDGHNIPRIVYTWAEWPFEFLRQACIQYKSESVRIKPESARKRRNGILKTESLHFTMPFASQKC